MRKQYATNRLISFVLVMFMVITMIPTHFFPQAADVPGKPAEARPNDGEGEDGRSLESIFEDLFWDEIRDVIVPEVSAEGLPEGAEAELTIVDPFSTNANANRNSTGKSSSSTSTVSSQFGEFLDFYDIKAVDPETGEELHPQGEVEVTIKNARIKTNQSVYLIHVLDNEDVIRNAANAVEVTEASFVHAFQDAAAAAYNATGKLGVVYVEVIDDLDINGRTIKFKTSSFSIFAIGSALHPDSSVDRHKRDVLP